MFEAKGYKAIHMSAPDKKYSQEDYVGPSYLDEYIEMMMSWGAENVVLDRSAYGELIWPHIYGRRPVLDEDDFETLREIEATLDVQYILMEDPDLEAHWKRCVDNKEPMNRSQFLTARSLYNNMAKKYGFTKKQLSDFTALQKEVEKPVEQPKVEALKVEAGIIETAPLLTAEQKKLIKANAINDILGKRILKAKGPEYEELEQDIRGFLNSKLGLLLGSTTPDSPFSKEEVDVLKLFISQLKSKQEQQTNVRRK